MRFQLLLLISFFSIIKLITSSIVVQKRWAYLNITAVNKLDNTLIKTNFLTDSALYGTNSPYYPIQAQLVATISYAQNDNYFDKGVGNLTSQLENSYGCSTYQNANLPDNYIALVSRGECTFERKIQVAVECGALAIIIYNSDQDIFTMLVRNNSIPNVLVVNTVGYLLLNYMINSNVYISLKPGPVEIIESNSLPSRASIYFVAIAFLVVLIVTIIWLSVYYVQKYRYYNAKKRLDNRLKKATQKALTKIPVRKLKPDDREINETCAICLENYGVNDSIRELPCGHYFHQKDVDLWLVEHRTCPMCKINILQACGIEINRSPHFLAQYMNFMRLRNPNLNFNQTYDATTGQSRLNAPNAQTHVDLNETSPSSIPPPQQQQQHTQQQSVNLGNVFNSSTKKIRPEKRTTQTQAETIIETAPRPSRDSLTSKLLETNKNGNSEVSNESNDIPGARVLRPFKSSENKMFQCETDKSDIDFTEVPL